MEECNKSYGANNHTSLLSHAQSQSRRFCHATWRDETKTAERETKVSHERSKKCIKRKILPDIFCLFLGGDAK